MRSTVAGRYLAHHPCRPYFVDVLLERPGNVHPVQRHLRQDHVGRLERLQFPDDVVAVFNGRAHDRVVLRLEMRSGTLNQAGGQPARRERVLEVRVDDERLLHLILP